MSITQETAAIIFYGMMLIEVRDRIIVPGGLRDIRIFGVAPEYPALRKFKTVAGRFFDFEDSASRVHVADITPELAIQLYGSETAAIGKEIRLAGLRFAIIGTFRESMQLSGQSEIAGNAVLIPYPVSRFMVGNNAVKMLLFAVADTDNREHTIALVRNTIQSRHQADSLYRIEELQFAGGSQ
jgi:putative ABC transport system permease protein